MRYVVESVFPDACGVSSYLRVYEVSEEIESFPNIYQRSSRTGECYSIGADTARRVTPIPPRRLVRGELEPGSGPNRLVADTVAWADGTRGPAQIRDSVRGQPCTIRHAGGGQGPAVCSPPSNAWRGWGPACDEPWARAVRDGCPLSTEDFAVSTECDSVTVSTIGDVVPEAELDAAPECTLGYVGEVVYSLNPAPEDLLAWLRLDLRGEGRLQRRVWVDEDGGEWPTLPDYYDSELGVDCVVRSWTHERCLPSPTVTQYDGDRLFADDRCTEPAAYVSDLGCRVIEYVWRGSCADAYGTIGPDYTSPEPIGLYRLGEPLTGPLYERDEATGACQPRAFDEGAALFRLVPADLDDLAVVHRAME